MKSLHGSIIPIPPFPLMERDAASSVALDRMRDERPQIGFPPLIVLPPLEWETQLPTSIRPAHTTVISATSTLSIQPALSLPCSDSHPYNTVSYCLTTSALTTSTANAIQELDPKVKRSLLPDWLKSILQVSLGATLGAGLALKLNQETAIKPPLPVEKSPVSNLSASKPPAQSTIPQTTTLQTTAALMAAPEKLLAPPPPPATQPLKLPAIAQPELTARPPVPTAVAAPQAMMVVDRFYVPSDVLTPHQKNRPSKMVVVDRYYLPTQPQKTNSPLPSELPTIPLQDTQRLLTTREVAVPPSKNPLNSNRLPIAIPASSPLASLPSFSQTSQPQPTYALQGVLELGEQSAALFQSGTNTYSFKIGEKIGTTNWILSSLKNGKAVLKDGQQTRLIHVGDSF